MSSDRSSPRRQRSSLIIPIVGAVIGFVAALFLLRELDIFESASPPQQPTVGAACNYPADTYYDRLCNLVARATVDIQTKIPPQTAANCVEQELDCRIHRENLRQGLPISEKFRDDLFDLDPTEQAADWHTRYLRAIAQLHSAYNAQFQALQASSRQDFQDAHQRTQQAAEEAQTLFEDFQTAFTDERLEQNRSPSQGELSRSD